MRTYPEYKDSGVEWIGEIPEGWNTRRIKHLSQVKRGSSPRPIDDPKYFDDENGEYSWVRISDVSASEKYLEKTTQKLSELGSSLSTKMTPGDIFLSIAGTVGKPIITNIKCCIHDGFVWFENLKYEKELLYQIFLTGLCFQGLGKMGTQLNLNTDTVGGISIPIPSLSEQKQIADYLDRKTQQIYDLIEKTERKIELLKEQRSSLINQCVTKGLDPNAEMKDSGVEWIGEIPRGWDFKSTKFHFLYKKGSQGQMLTSTFLGENPGDYPVYSGQTENEGVLGTWSEYEFDYPNGVIFVTTVGAKSMTNRLVRGKFSLSQNCLILIPRDDQIDPSFINYFLHYDFLYRKELLPRILQPSLRMEDIDQYKILVPPLSEQKQISDYLDEETSKIDQMVDMETKRIELLKEYRQSLISNVVTGKIDVRDEVLQ